MSLVEADSVFGKAALLVVVVGFVFVAAGRNGLLDGMSTEFVILAGFGLVGVLALLVVADTLAAPTPGKLLFSGAVGLGISAVFVDAVPALPGLAGAFILLIITRIQRIREVFFNA